MQRREPKSGVDGKGLEQRCFFMSSMSPCGSCTVDFALLAVVSGEAVLLHSLGTWLMNVLRYKLGDGLAHIPAALEKPFTMLAATQERFGGLP